MNRTLLSSTYRLQLRGPHADAQGRAFGFAEASAIIPYLADLGISHVYCSPILTSNPASNHGYDVIDPTSINPELGGIDGFRDLVRTAREHGMGVIIDVVPNHVGIDDPRTNRWWWDVLRLGPDSEYESYFDIDWHEDNGAGGKLGLPILGAEGDDQSIRFDHVDGEKVLAYHDHVFPIAPGTETDDPYRTYLQQHYRLMYWRDGVMSYRRFFSVNGLAGLRQEEPAVFEHTHRIIRHLCEEDLIDGVRVDHPDGLADPFEYLCRLRTVIGPDRWLVIEKILNPDEPLDARLTVDGTTGYDALRELDGIFINRRAEDTLSMLALEQSGSTWNDTATAATERDLKRRVAVDELGAEVRRLARALRRDHLGINDDSLPTDVTALSDEQLIPTIADVVAAMPVYRADYLSLSRVTASVIANMVRRFPSRRPALNLIASGLVAEGEAKTRFAQVCGAVMAKGVEDTTFYRACRLVATQEVGGAPGKFGVSSAEFHLLQHERAMLWPRTMTTLTTHDTKRSEDVRARIISLSECPVEFSELVREVVALTPPPDSATGLFLLQNFIGVWPEDGTITLELIERMKTYAIKAVREASVHTTWTDANEEYESSICRWIEALSDGPATQTITAFVQPIARAARVVSLGRRLLHAVGPGIPDTYQGNEFFDDSLVDPDNRRFVDYDARRASLNLLAASDTVCAAAYRTQGLDDGASTLLDAAPDLIKMGVIREALRLRHLHPECFGPSASTRDNAADAHGSGYRPVFAKGPASMHVVGMSRSNRSDEGSVIAVATRLPRLLQMRGGWGETTLTLPDGAWIDVYTGQTYSGKVALTQLFQQLPVALCVPASWKDEVGPTTSATDVAANAPAGSSSSPGTDTTHTRQGAQR